MNKEVSMDQMQSLMKDRLEGLRQTSWWYITGGPHTGKSAIITNLAKRGYKTVPEAARVHIDLELDKGRTIEQIRADEIEFQINVLRMKEKVEDETPEEDLVFWDRGLDGDSMAYLSVSRRPKGYPFSIYDSGITIVAKRRCQGVFLLDQLPFYVQDYARVEDNVKGTQIHQRIGFMYELLGYKPIRVPLFPGSKAESINRRSQFIVDQVRKVNKEVPDLPYPFSIPIQHPLPI